MNGWRNCIKIFVFLQVVYKVNKSMFDNIKTIPKRRAPETLGAATPTGVACPVEDRNEKYNINKQ